MSLNLKLDFHHHQHNPSPTLKMVNFPTPRFSSEGPSGASTPSARASGTSTPTRTPRRSTAEDYFYSTMPATAYAHQHLDALSSSTPAGAKGKKETAVKENAKSESLAKKIKKMVNKGTSQYWGNPERSVMFGGVLPSAYQVKVSAEEKN